MTDDPAGGPAQANPADAVTSAYAPPGSSLPKTADPVTRRFAPALATLATAVALFLAVSWLGVWLWLPAIGRAIGVGLFFLLTAAAFAPFL